MGSLWWRELKAIWSMEEWGREFDDRFNWKVGNGKESRFWEDKWVGDLELKNKFPRLYSLCRDKDELLECCGVWEEGEWNWKFGWRRNLFDWEKSQVGQLFEEIRGLSIDPDIDDSWVWRDGMHTDFSVKSAYSVLRGHSEGICQNCTTFSGVLRLCLRPRF